MLNTRPATRKVRFGTAVRSPRASSLYSGCKGLARIASMFTGVFDRFTLGMKSKTHK